MSCRKIDSGRRNGIFDYLNSYISGGMLYF